MVATLHGQGSLTFNPVVVYCPYRIGSMHFHQPRTLPLSMCAACAQLPQHAFYKRDRSRPLELVAIELPILPRCRFPASGQSQTCNAT